MNITQTVELNVGGSAFLVFPGFPHCLGERFQIAAQQTSSIIGMITETEGSDASRTGSGGMNRVRSQRIEARHGLL